MSPETDNPAEAIWTFMQRVLNFEPVFTDEQMQAALHAVTAMAGGVPNAFSGVVRAEAAEGEPVYTFYWVRGGSFGSASVLRPPDRNAYPKTTGWIRPLSLVQKFDIDVDVSSHYVVRSDIAVKLKVGLHWSDGDADVVLDATRSMTSLARPDLEQLIAVVLSGVHD